MIWIRFRQVNFEKYLKYFGLGVWDRSIDLHDHPLTQWKVLCFFVLIASLKRLTNFLLSILTAKAFAAIFPLTRQSKMINIATYICEMLLAICYMRTKTLKKFFYRFAWLVCVGIPASHRLCRVTQTNAVPRYILKIESLNNFRNSLYSTVS